MSHHRSIFYCLFLAGPGVFCPEGWARRGAGVPGSGTWCTNPRKPLFFRSLCTWPPGHFLLQPLRTCSKDPRKPLFFRPFAPSLRTFSAGGRHGLGARIPCKPLFFRPLAPRLRIFSACRGRGLAQRSLQALILSVPFAPSLRTFSTPPPRTCTNPRTPLFFRPLCTSLRTFSVRGRRGLGAQIPAKPFVLPSLCTNLRTFRPAAAVTFSKSKVDKCAIMLYHSICQLLQQTS